MPPATGDPVVDGMVRAGELTAARSPGGIDAVLAVEPVPASNGSTAEDVVAGLREERL